MRLLIVVPHYFKGLATTATNRSRRAGASTERLAALSATLRGLCRSFDTGAHGLDHQHRTAWQATPRPRSAFDVIVCTAGGAHLLDDLPVPHPPFRHHSTDADPLMLGFECHKVMAAARGRYDYYGYVEDDIVIADPFFFAKRRLFDRSFGPAALLQPQRFEAGAGAVAKLYVDYHLAPARTAAYQSLDEGPVLRLPFLDGTIEFERASYPSSGCFFLSAGQLEMWAGSPHFLDGDVSYLSPLDSAVALSIMKTFRVYKPILEHASFLEVEHASPRWAPSVSEIVRLAPQRDRYLSQLIARHRP